MRVIEIFGEPVLHGGQERFVEAIIKNINIPDLVIDVLTPYECEYSGFKTMVQEYGGMLYEFHLPFLPGKSRKSIYAPLNSFFKTHHYEIAHIHSGSISVLAYAAEAAQKNDIKKIIVHSHCTGEKSIKQKIVQCIFERKIADNATDFLACSRQAGEMKFPAKIIDHEMVIVKNGINIGLFQRDDEKRKKQKALLGIPEDAKVIGHVGRFTYQKNHHFLVNLYDAVQKKINNCYLLLVGDGEVRDEIQKTVTELGLQNKVIFTGNVDNVEDYYQAMDLFLFPSNFEGLGYVFLEAQAAGLPCIASEAVPDDVILSKKACKISLNQETQWVKTSLEYLHLSISDNHEIIQEAGFDIQYTIEQIRRIYEKPFSKHHYSCV